MDKPKNKVGKSKSSNSPIATKPEPNRTGKKSRSNAEIKPLVLKKRGVYVEKTCTKTSLNPQDNAPKRLKCPRPRKKGFLTSVLAILSKPTTGTQFPDTSDTNDTKEIERSRYKLRSNKEYDGFIIEELNCLKNESKYKSKILNKRSEQDQFVVLQSKKDISHSSINYSDRSSKASEAVINWAEFLPPLVKKRQSEMINTNITNDKKIILNKLDINKPNTETNERIQENEDKIFNFFVDLIENTFNVYDVKTDFDVEPIDSDNSLKAALEIDETVADKLSIKIPPKDPDSSSVSHRSPIRYCNLISNENSKMKDEIQLSPKPNRPERKRKLKTSSFNTYNKTFTDPIPKSYSFQKKWSKKDRKRNLLNLLKEELRTDLQEVEETQNFFQALKQMARNKRRNQKAIHFDESAKKTSEGDVFNCMFKRRRLISGKAKPNKKRTNSPVPAIKPYPTYSSTSSCEKIAADPDVGDRTESRYSLEVYGFDYVVPKKQALPIQKNDIVDEVTSSFSDITFDGANKN